jgi:RNA polymerase sigma-70 factor (ECF subfamily)
MSTAARLANLDVDAGMERSRPRAPSDIASWFDEALPRLYGYFLPRVGNRVAIAEDLTQETLLAAIGSRSGPIDRSTVMPWLFGIARHKLMDHYRAEDRERRQFGLGIDPELIAIGPSPPLGHLDLDSIHVRDDIVATLDKLPPRQRSALVIRYFDGCDVPATAALLHTSVHATESLLARGRIAFRRIYRGITGEPS